MNIFSIGVLGAGTWGMALARLLSRNGYQVTVYSSLEQEVRNLEKTHRHPKLPGMEIPQDIEITGDIQKAVFQKDMLIMAVSSPYIRSTAEKAVPYLQEGQLIVSVAKGIETDTLMTMTEIIQDVLPENLKNTVRLCALSGPTHAEEVAMDLPTTIVASCRDQKTAQCVQDVFSGDVMRVYTNSDIKGVELCGALKNIMALASGILTGIGYGDNARAALVTRGLAEMCRLGLKMGCEERTFYGLTGIGDLVVTATSRHSRNYQAGQLIGQGLSPKEAIEKVGMVVEGINALPAAVALCEKYEVDMPIVQAVNAVIHHEISPITAFNSLMRRRRKAENI